MLHHAVGAGDDAAVVEHGTSAARQVMRAGAHRQAAVAYEQVLARGDLLDATTRGRLREGYAWSLSNTNRLDAAAGEAAAAVDAPLRLSRARGRDGRRRPRALAVPGR